MPQQAGGQPMNVLTVFAHPASQSFCHAVLDRFDSGLRDAGHTSEIADLYATCDRRTRAPTIFFA